MSKEYQTLTIEWRKVAITVRHCKDWSKGHFNINGTRMTHTEIINIDNDPLPITSTGYKSHFMDSTHLDNYDGILDYVTQWLDHEAQSKQWKAYVVDKSQLKLF